MAAGDLITVERLRGHLRLEDRSDDDVLASIVTAASAWMKSELGRDVLAADYTHTFSGEGTRGLTLPQAPVSSVTSVTIDGVLIPQRTSVIGDGWVLRGDRVELVGYRFSRGVENVEIAYRAGWAEAPEDLVQAVLEEAALRYRDRDWGGATYKLQGGDIVDRRGEASSGSWAFIRGVIDKYRRVRV